MSILSYSQHCGAGRGRSGDRRHRLARAGRGADSPASVTIYRRGGARRRCRCPPCRTCCAFRPASSVATTGPRGTQTQVRIRGAEANHTLVFVDGIRFNDPAAGNEARFELLTSDSLSRVEIVRGPQSALWGSEALGGVIAAETRRSVPRRRLRGRSAEYGSLDSARLSGRYAVRAGDVGVMASAGLAAQRRNRFLRRAAASATASTIVSASLKIEARPSDAHQPRRRRPLDPGDEPV